MPLCDVIRLNTLCLASCVLTYRAQHARHGQRPHLNGNAKLTCVVTQSGLKPLKTRCLFFFPCKSFIRLQSKGFYLIKAELERGQNNVDTKITRLSIQRDSCVPAGGADLTWQSRSSYRAERFFTSRSSLTERQLKKHPTGTPDAGVVDDAEVENGEIEEEEEKEEVNRWTVG